MKEKKESPEMTREDVKQHNLRFYSEACEVPSDALREIKAGRLKGKSDVNPMWRMKRLTEIFGPCGFGWKYTIDRQWEEQHCNEVKCFCNVSLYVRDPETGEWSEPIPGNGGSSIVELERNGPHVNDEGYKMALTDALSIAMKPLGIGANVWYGPKASGGSDSKYERYNQSPQNPPAHQSSGLSQDQIKQAMDELNGAKSKKELEQVFNKWSKISPSFTKNGTAFYNRVVERINEFTNKVA